MVGVGVGVVVEVSRKQTVWYQTNKEAAMRRPTLNKEAAMQTTNGTRKQAERMDGILRSLWTGLDWTGYVPSTITSIGTGGVTGVHQDRPRFRTRRCNVMDDRSKRCVALLGVVST